MPNMWGADDPQDQPPNWGKDVGLRGMLTASPTIAHKGGTTIGWSPPRQRDGGEYPPIWGRLGNESAEGSHSTKSQ